MIILVVPVLAALIGALVYALATNTKAAEMGRLVFFAGVLVLIWGLAGHTLRFG